MTPFRDQRLTVFCETPRWLASSSESINAVSGSGIVISDWVGRYVHFTGRYGQVTDRGVSGMRCIIAGVLTACVTDRHIWPRYPVGAHDQTASLSNRGSPGPAFFIF